MTKVQLSYDLVHPLGDDGLECIARVHGVYGIQRVLLKQPERNAVTVEYDASRMMPDDVEAVLVRGGVPIVRR